MNITISIATKTTKEVSLAHKATLTGKSLGRKVKIGLGVNFHLSQIGLEVLQNMILDLAHPFAGNTIALTNCLQRLRATSLQTKTPQDNIAVTSRQWFNQ